MPCQCNCNDITACWAATRWRALLENRFILSPVLTCAHTNNTSTNTHAHTHNHAHRHTQTHTNTGYTPVSRPASVECAARVLHTGRMLVISPHTTMRDVPFVSTVDAVGFAFPCNATNAVQSSAGSHNAYTCICIPHTANALR